MLHSCIVIISSILSAPFIVAMEDKGPKDNTFQKSSYKPLSKEAQQVIHDEYKLDKDIFDGKITQSSKKTAKSHHFVATIMKKKVGKK